MMAQEKIWKKSEKEQKETQQAQKTYENRTQEATPIQTLQNQPSTSLF
jgi:hypothetical protein